MTEPQWPVEGNNPIQGLACRRCDVWIQQRFPRSLDEIGHFFYGTEYNTIEPFPVILFCPQCGDEVETTGREMTIDTVTGIIIRAKLDRVPEAEGDDFGT